MVFIKKDVNKLLLLLIVVLLLVFLWSTAYYENKLSNISTYYNNQIQQYTGNLVLEDLNRTVSLKETFQKDKEILEKGYSDLKFENDELRKQKDNLEAELTKLNNDLTDAKSKFNILEKRFKELQDNLIKANEDISRLSARNNELCRKLKEKGGEC